MGRRGIPLYLILLGAGICLPFVVFEKFPCDDFAREFVWSIRAFSRGNWEQAFPVYRLPLYFLSADAFTLFGIPAFKAAQFAMAMWFILAAIPTYYLFYLTHGDRIATWATVLYLLCPRVLRYVNAVVMEPVVWAFWITGVCCLAYFARRPSWKLTIGLGGVMGAMTLCTEATIAWTVLLAMGLLAIEMYHGIQAFRKGKKCNAIPLKFVTALILCGIIVVPWGYYVYRHTGKLGLSTKQNQLIEKAFSKHKQNGHKDVREDHRAQKKTVNVAKARKHPTKGIRNNVWKRSPELSAAALSLALPATVQISSIPVVRRLIENADKFHWGQSFYQIFKRGFYHFYAVFALLGGAVLIWRRTGTWWDVFLLSCLCAYLGAYMIMRVLQLNPDAPFALGRHVTVTLPLILGWTAVGTSFAFDGLKKVFPRKDGLTAKVIAGVAVFALIWDAYLPIRPSLDEEDQNERAAKLETGEWLQTLARDYLPPLEEIESEQGYPVIRATSREVPQQIAFRGKFHFRPFKLYDNVQTFVRRCKRHNTAMMLWDATERKRFPEIWKDWDKLPPELVVLYDKWKDIEDPRVVIGYKPNLDMPEE